LVRVEETSVQGATVSRWSVFYRQEPDGLYLAGTASDVGGNVYSPAIPVSMPGLAPGGEGRAGRVAWRLSYGPWSFPRDVDFTLLRMPDEAITVPAGTFAGVQRYELTGESAVGKATQRYWYTAQGAPMPAVYEYQDDQRGSSLRYELLSATWLPPSTGLELLAGQGRLSGSAFLDRGGPERAGSAAGGSADLPASPALHQVWQFTNPNDLTAPPLLAGDLLLLGDVEGTLWALDPDGGGVRWTFTTGQPIVATPAVAGGIAYVASGPRLFALDAEEGLFLWSVLAEDVIGTSPLALDSDLFFGAEDGFLYAVDARKGTLRWRFQAGSPVNGISATVQKDHRVLCLGTSEGAFLALSASTGDLLWQADLDGAILAAPALFGGAAYAGLSGGMVPGQVTALDLDDGTVQWTTPLPGAVAGGLAVDRDSVYVGTSLGAVLALDRATGSERWRLRLGSGVANPPLLVGNALVVADTLGSVHLVNAATGAVVTARSGLAPFGAPPAYGRGRLFLADRYRNAYAFSLGAPSPAPTLRVSLEWDQLAADVNRGARPAAGPTSWQDRPLVLLENGDLWQFDPRSGDSAPVFEFGGYVGHAPLVDGDTAYIGLIQRLDGSGAVIAFDLARQEIRWHSDQEGSIATPLSLDGGRVFASVTTAQGSVLRALDAERGDLLWEEAIPAAAAPPLASDGNVYLALGSVRAWAGATGATLWQSPDLNSGGAMAVCRGNLIAEAVGEAGPAVVALDVVSGTLRWWSQKPIAFPYGRPACDVENGQVIVGGLDGQIRAFDLVTGAQNWTFRAGEPFLAGVLVVDGVVYGATEQTTLVVLDAGNGRLLAWYTPPHAGSSQTGPHVVGDRVYLNDGLFLYALQVSRE